jgi:hypothetical protein
VSVFNNYSKAISYLFLLTMLSSCGEYGVVAGPSENAAARFEYSRDGATDRERVEDGIDCGMDYFLGTLTIQFDKAEQIDACMRGRGYEVGFPSSDGERRLWTLD